VNFFFSFLSSSSDFVVFSFSFFVLFPRKQN